jgi:hypothetical protein
VSLEDAHPGGLVDPELDLAGKRHGGGVVHRESVLGRARVVIDGVEGEIDGEAPARTRGSATPTSATLQSRTGRPSSVTDGASCAASRVPYAACSAGSSDPLRSASIAASLVEGRTLADDQGVGQARALGQKGHAHVAVVGLGAGRDVRDGGGGRDRQARRKGRVRSMP